MTAAASIVVPLLSILVGAVITYVVNVRQRRTNYVDDLFNAAIAAVAAAEVSIDWIASAHRSAYMTEEDHAAFQSWLVTQGMRTWATRSAEANEALARVSPYAPDLAALMPYKPDDAHRGTHTEIIRVLRRGPAPR